MKEFADVLEALAKLVAVLGPTRTVIAFAVLAAFVLLRSYLRERKERSLAEEKEAQIQRMADEIRMYRFLDLKAKGLSEEEAKRLLGPGKPNPLGPFLPSVKKGGGKL